MQAEITTAFEMPFRLTLAVGAIVVTGNGRGFMAGADIKEYAAQIRPGIRCVPEARRAACTPPSRPTQAGDRGGQRLRPRRRIRAGALLRYRHGLGTAAKFGLPEIKLGLVPGGGGTQRSVAKLGRNRANLLLMTGAICRPRNSWPGVSSTRSPRRTPCCRGRWSSHGMIAAEPPEAIEGLKHLTALALAGDRADRASKKNANSCAISIAARSARRGCRSSRQRAGRARRKKPAGRS